MTMYYSDESRYDDPNALPDIEVFYVTKIEAAYNLANLDHADALTVIFSGWYYWYCLPGCMPDSTPFGPFKSESEALADARECAA